MFFTPRFWQKALFEIALLAVVFGNPTQAVAQEAVRMSLAGESAAASRRRAALDPAGNTLRLGPSSWTLTTGVDFEVNDNIRFASTRPAIDLITRPRLTALMGWRVSDKNSVNLAIGAGYSAYAIHSQYNRAFITPGSELSFDLYAADVWVNFHERLSLTEEGYEDPTLVGNAGFSQLQNTIGLSATWDLNKLVIRLGYDHANYAQLSGGSGLPDGDSDIFGASAGYRCSTTTTTGFESGLGWTRYRGDSTLVSQAIDWNVGAFIEAQLRQHATIKAAAGYTAYAPTRSTLSPDAEFTGIYGRLAFIHRLNHFVDYSLTGGRNISFGFFAGTIDLYTAVLEARWHLFQKLSLGTGLEFEHGSQVLVGRESFDRYGPRVSLERPITARASGSLRYQYYQRESNAPGGDYSVNLVTLSITYRL